MKGIEKLALIILATAFLSVIGKYFFPILLLGGQPRRTIFPGSTSVPKNLSHERDLSLHGIGQHQDLRASLTEIFRRGGFEEAAQMVLQVTQLRPGETWAWKSLAQAYVKLGKRDAALDACRRTLTLATDDPKSQLDIAKLYVTLKEYEAAERLLLQVKQQTPNLKGSYALLANVQFLKGSFRDSAATWAQAYQLKPHNAEYRFQEARALYFDGRIESALAIFTELLNDPIQRRHALDFLVDDAISMGELRSAALLLEQHVVNIQPDDEERMLKLVRIYFELGQFERCLTVLERCFMLNPRSGRILLFQATCLKRKGVFGAAIDRYEHVLRLNPWALEALKGLAATYSSQGFIDKALTAVRRARAFDPTNPHLLLEEAEYLYTNRRRSAARDLLVTWLTQNREPALPVLLYHGLTPFERDPLLASPVHMTTGVFENQMRVLHEAGFATVTISDVHGWLQGKTTLPPKPVLITFDDARIDSFRYADPILQKYGFKATMFIPINNVEKNISGYASWHQLKQYGGTDRWDIQQSHGNFASDRIPIDSDGHRGLFLINRQWLESEGRLETADEWIARITRDYMWSRDRVGNELGGTPSAFAFPAGNFGQEEIPNTPEAAPVNLQIVRQFFVTSYHQDGFGLNPQSRDPVMLNRFEPPPRWTGDDLLRHIADQTPFTRVRLTLLRWAVRERRFHEATYWLDRLRTGGCSEDLALIEEARIHFAAGDVLGGYQLIERARMQRPLADVHKALRDIQPRWRTSWACPFKFQQESADRERWGIRNYLRVFSSGGVGLSAGYEHHIFREGGLRQVRDDVLAVQASGAVSLFHKFVLDLAQHLFSGSLKEAFSFGASIRSGWTDTLSTQAEFASEPTETVRALNAGIREREFRFSIAWRDPQDKWRVFSSERILNFSDGNHRHTEVLELSRQLGAVHGLWTIYRLTADNSDDRSPNYYTPRQFLQHQIGWEHTWNPWKTVDVDVGQFVGYGGERESNPKFTYALQAGLRIALPENSAFALSVSVGRKDEYYRNVYEFVLSHEF